MPTYYKGAALGSHWHSQDARLTGLYATSPGTGTAVFTGSTINHVLNNSVSSPFLSLSKSYEIALDYALLTGVAAQIPTPSNPAFVYEIDLDEPLPNGVSLIDPVRLIVSSSMTPGYYHHDGGPDFLLGIVDESNYSSILRRMRVTPNGSDIVSPTLTRELKTVVRVLRDAEVLATGIIPANCIRRWNVSL